MRTYDEIKAGLPSRLGRELETIETMIGIYCRAHHHPEDSLLCPRCSRLLHYAARRLFHCPFKEDKSTCGNCLVHCYKKDMREDIRAVMRYAGPRMPLRHPFMALRHVLDNRRSPQRPAEIHQHRKEPQGSNSGIAADETKSS